MSQDRLDASLDIDKASSLEIIRIIQDEDAKVATAVSAERDRIAHAVDQIVERVSHGGRLFYAGAGTSGRMAMLDASELPPTYGIDPSLVTVIMAGGQRAFFEAAEGAEDDDRRSFIETLEPSDTRLALMKSVAGASFRSVLASDRATERAWYNFRNSRATAAIEQWLKQIGLR